ncbi:hypothetical protein RHGRI_014198 [Rhododendron griersonianum]|uniref:hAT-like transposase RNase-H fold domain-containing protein n=1 Tax=Rhododendron griersonianum TaxID=479676 RepID=A0AAV6K8M7_9ERIC|nr:hypothetical protein RHGRI_014198 [Rhododendron griersonianum]
MTIIKHNYHFQFVEHERIRDIHSFLNPTVKSISRNTAKADVLKLFERDKVTFKRTLESVASRICPTSDLWSSLTSDGYLALMAHYIDEDWVLQKKILNFRHVPPPHSGSILAKRVIHLLKDWGIDKKIFTLTLDNAKYNDGLVDVLKVQEGLKVIDEARHSVRESVKTCPSEEEWERVKRITRFLKPFYEITILFSGCRYPTANLYFHGVWKIQLLIKEEMENLDDVISSMAKRMKGKFDKYWECYSMVLSFAIILDPRYKLQFVEFCLKNLDLVNFTNRVKSIREKLYLLFEDYVSRSPASTFNRTFKKGRREYCSCFMYLLKNCRSKRRMKRRKSLWRILRVSCCTRRQYNH